MITTETTSGIQKEPSVREQRKTAVLDAYYATMKELYAKKRLFTMDEVVQTALKRQAPRFFVGYEQAKRFVSMLLRGKKLPFVNKNKIAMYHELCRRFKERCSDGHYCYIALDDIVHEPAPSFYLDAESFRGIVYKTLRQKRRKSSGLLQ